MASKTRYDRYLNYLLNHKVIVVIVVLGLVVILIGQFMEGLDKIYSFFRAPSLQPIHLGYSQYKNGRFGFVFEYPSDWLSSIGPVNGDGQQVFHPDSHNIYISGSGMHFVSDMVDDSVAIEHTLPGIYFNEDEFEKYERFKLETDGSELHFKLLESGTFIKVVTVVQEECVFGYQIIEFIDENSKMPTWEKSIYTAVNGKSYMLKFVCPREQLDDDLLKVFSEVANTFDVMEGLD